MELKKQILVALGLDKSDELQLAWQSKTEDGTILVSTAEELEAGVDISVLTEDGTTIPLPAGTYILDTGVSVRVEDEGIVAELIESETEEEDTAEEVEAAEDDGKEADIEDWSGLEKRIQNLEDAVASLKADKDGGDMEEDEEPKEEEMSAPSKNPRTKTTKTTETVEFSKEELKAEIEKLKEELGKEPAESPLTTNKFSNEKVTLSKKEYRNLSRREKFIHDLNN
tara:strand:- start:449 stop:1126 length:678 start_codon:yes stop_codon:yes gene_type:complete